MRRTPRWRLRLTAAGTILQAGLLHTLDYLSAVLDRRAFSSAVLDYAARLGTAWRRHTADARTRLFGPGRGVIAVIIHRPTRKEKA